MNDPSSSHEISQKIFQMGLSVETVSVYLLCCGLVEAGAALSVNNLKDKWNGTPQQLQEGLDALEKRNILFRIIADSNDRAVYRILDAGKWKCH